MLTSGSGDRLITVGAVSKGIIKRDQQHNVAAYQSTYQRNPFDSNNTPEEVEQYLLEVERKKQPGGGSNAHPSQEYEVRMEERKPRQQEPQAGQTYVRQAHTPPPTPSVKEEGTDALTLPLDLSVCLIYAYACYFLVACRSAL